MSRLVSALCASLCALALGAFATAAGAQEASPSPHPSATASPTPTPSGAASPSPSVTPSASPSPSPSPSPRPSATVRPGTPTSSPTPGSTPEGAEGEVTVEADPSTTALRVGERMTIEALVTNGTDEPHDLTLSIELPQELAFVASVPAGEVVAELPQGGQGIAVQLGEVAAGDARTVLVELEADAVGAAVVTLGVSGDATSAPEVLLIDVVESDEEVTGALSLEASPPIAPLAEVGDALTYELTVRNTSDRALQDVIVVERVAPEVDVIAAPLVDGVDAVQVGRFMEQEDIVWVMDELEPGEHVNLPWRAVVDTAGDLEIRTSARATAVRAEPARASARNFLAVPEGTADPLNPPFTPIRKRVAITVPAELPAPGTLPVTGLAAWMWAVVGAGIVLAGLTFYRFGSPGARGKRIPAAVLLVSIVAAACVSSDPEQQPNAVGTPEVRGRRIERGNDGQPTPVPNEQDGQDDGGQGEGDAGEEPGEAEEPGEEEVEPEGDEVPEVEPPVAQPDPSPEPPVGGGTETRIVVREITLGELPVTDVPTTSGSTASFVWDEPSRSLLSGTSSTVGGSDDDVNVITTIHDDGRAISADVTVMNLSEDERLALSGHLVHQIGTGGRLAELTSDPIDTVLDPGGRITATFRYLLPTGNYQAGGSFVST